MCKCQEKVSECNFKVLRKLPVCSGKAKPVVPWKPSCGPAPPLVRAEFHSSQNLSIYLPTLPAYTCCCYMYQD